METLPPRQSVPDQRALVKPRYSLETFLDISPPEEYRAGNVL